MGDMLRGSGTVGQAEVRNPEKRRGVKESWEDIIRGPNLELGVLDSLRSRHHRTRPSETAKRRRELGCEWFGKRMSHLEDYKSRAGSGHNTRGASNIPRVHSDEEARARRAWLKYLGATIKYV